MHTNNREQVASFPVVINSLYTNRAEQLPSSNRALSQAHCNQPRGGTHNLQTQTTRATKSEKIPVIKSVVRRPFTKIALAGPDSQFVIKL